MSASFWHPQLSYLHSRYLVSYLAYPLHVQLSELAIIALFPPVEALRIHWAHRGNLTETPAYLTFSLLLSGAVVAICFYLGWFQAYVLLAEIVACGVEGGWVVLESLVKLGTMATLTAAVAGSGQGRRAA